MRTLKGTSWVMDSQTTMLDNLSYTDHSSLWVSLGFFISITSLGRLFYNLIPLMLRNLPVNSTLNLFMANLFPCAFVLTLSFFFFNWNGSFPSLTLVLSMCKGKTYILSVFILWSQTWLCKMDSPFSHYCRSISLHLFQDEFNCFKAGDRNHI